MNSLAANEVSKDRGTQKFGSISGIDDTMQDNLNRITGLSPTLNGVRVTTREDANLLLFLQENEEHGVYLHDMGQIDESERSNLIIDKDTQLVYDVRKDMDMARLERQTSVTSAGAAGVTSGIASPRLGSEASVGN